MQTRRLPRRREALGALTLMQSGILLLDKPLGLVVERSIATGAPDSRCRKGGSRGSLDPLATGMLPICLGEATKNAVDVLSGRNVPRHHWTRLPFTATGDLPRGAVVGKPPPAAELDAAVIDAVRQRFSGPADFRFPLCTSALKRDGQPLLPNWLAGYRSRARHARGNRAI